MTGPSKLMQLSKRGASLVEVLIAISIFSLILLAAFSILAESGKFLRANQEGLDAHRAGLSVISRLSAGIRGSKSEHMSTSPRGLVYASPHLDDGRVQYHNLTHKLVWQKWVAFYLDGRTLTQRERAMTPSHKPGSAPSPNTFANTPIRKTFSENVGNFVIKQSPSDSRVWIIELTLGDMDRGSRYGVELISEVSTRN